MGDILYFDEDEELNDLVILKPQWVTEYISNVLESEEVIEKDGIFTREHERQLWGDLDSEMQDHFLRLMEKFDLSYRTWKTGKSALWSNVCLSTRRNTRNAGTPSQTPNTAGSGAALRALRELLDEKDPKHHWGGLKKVLPPEVHYLWLCDHHAKEYEI